MTDQIHINVVMFDISVERYQVFMDIEIFHIIKPIRDVHRTINILHILCLIEHPADHNIFAIHAVIKHTQSFVMFDAFKGAITVYTVIHTFELIIKLYIFVPDTDKNIIVSMYAHFHDPSKSPRKSSKSLYCLVNPLESHLSLYLVR